MNKVLIAVAMLGLTTLTASASGYAPAVITVQQQKQYKKIEVSAIPKDTVSKIMKDYGNYTIKEAYRADDGEYKLVLNKDGIDLTATFTSAGDFIKLM